MAALKIEQIDFFNLMDADFLVQVLVILPEFGLPTSFQLLHVVLEQITGQLCWPETP